MSIQAINNVFAAAPVDLSPSKVLVLLALANRTNDFGYCWPSYKKISEDTRLSRRQVIRILSELEESGEIIVTRRRKDNTNSASNMYQLHDKYLTSASDATSPPSDTTSPEVVTQSHQGSDTHDTRVVTSMSPEPSINHHKESVSSSDTLSPELAEVVQVYERSFGLIDKTSRDELNDYLNDFGADGIKSAIGKAKQRGKDWRYAKGIFRNWANEGRGAQLPTSGKSAEQVTSELKKLASSYGRSRFKIAEPELKEAGLYEIANSIGWTNLCTMRENDIKFAVYRVMQ